jgi:hypothetical protein
MYFANQDCKPELQTRIANQNCKPGLQTRIAMKIAGNLLAVRLWTHIMARGTLSHCGRRYCANPDLTRETAEPACAVFFCPIGAGVVFSRDDHISPPIVARINATTQYTHRETRGCLDCLAEEEFGNGITFAGPRTTLGWAMTDIFTSPLLLFA